MTETKKTSSKTPSKKTSKHRSSSARKANIYRILCIILLIVLIIVICLWAKDRYLTNQAEDTYDKLQEEANSGYVPPTIQETTAVEETEAAETAEELLYEIPEKSLDWATLADTNSDIYAWIYIPDTQIDYPIVQSATDDDYYLNHNLDGSKGYPGCIYTQSLNSKDFTDFNTVIYGHNMKNGSMFKGLHEFEDATYFDENEFVYIYTEDKTYVYQIYAAYESGNEHILYTYDFSTAKGRQDYLNKCYLGKEWKGNFREGVEVSSDSKIITLSTCISGQSSKRYLVQAMLVETKENAL